MSPEYSDDVQPEGGRGELGGDEDRPEGAEPPGGEPGSAVAGDPPGDQRCHRSGEQEVRPHGDGEDRRPRLRMGGGCKTRRMAGFAGPT
jgi:hypothetical protein